MAPECLRGDVYDHRADVWSIGCLYYEMLTGFPPFTGKNMTNLQENIKRGDYQIPKTIKLSIEGLHFLNSCLQYNPYDRFDWKDMKADAYVSHSEYSFQDLNYDTKLDDALYLSTVTMEHSQLLKLGLDKCHAWMQKNP